MTTTTTPAGPSLPCTRPPVLAVFLAGAPQIATNPRFTAHHHADDADDAVDWDAVLAEPGWSSAQRLLIHLAAALSGNPHQPPDALGADLTRGQTDLVLAMCQAARG